MEFASAMPMPCERHNTHHSYAIYLFILQPGIHTALTYLSPSIILNSSASTLYSNSCVSPEAILVVNRTSGILGNFESKPLQKPMTTPRAPFTRPKPVSIFFNNITYRNKYIVIISSINPSIVVPQSIHQPINPSINQKSHHIEPTKL